MLKVDEFVMEAGEQGASDIHIVAGHPVSYRIHGTIVSRDETILTKEETTCLIKEYTTEQQYHIFQETGELDFSKTSQNGLRLRLNIFMEQDSPAMALRILASRIPSPKELGLPKVVTNLIHLRRGLVLVTGATGSGKSTTLAALIHEISKIFHKNIITLEDPIEYVHTREASVVSQREIGRDTRSYANALRAALRQDPDVILVGEMRDLETIAAAVTAAEVIKKAKAKGRTHLFKSVR
ncbi:MAG: ATPase, T2SS/T4P/T4SS family, partial [Lachnospiraceae bacterium]